MYFLCVSDHTIQQYSSLLLICDLNKFIMGSLFLVAEFLRIFPNFILQNDNILLMCSLNLRSILLITPRSFTLSFIYFYFFNLSFIELHNILLFPFIYLVKVFLYNFFILHCFYFRTIDNIVCNAAHYVSYYLFIYNP